MAYLLPLILLAACRSAAQDRKHTIEAVAAETPAEKDGPPGFLCEGSTDLPDGCRIDVFAYFGNPLRGAHLKHSAVLVKEGKFSASFSLYAKRNLAGLYTFQVVFNPSLQQVRHQTLPALEKLAPLRVGTEEAAANDRKSVGENLLADMKGLVAIAEEARLKHVESKGKLETAAWEALLKDWHRRAARINVAAIARIEYRVLGFGLAVDDGMEHISGIVMDLCRCAARGQEKDLREGRERLDLMISKFENQLKAPPPKGAGAERVRDARRLLKEAVAAPEADRRAAKGRFRQSMVDLNSLAPSEFASVILEISGAATEVFDAIEEKKDVKGPLEKLDARLEELEKALQNAK